MIHDKYGSDKWINAHYDPVSALHSFSHCMVFSDIHADGDFKFIVADFGSGTDNIKLKMFKGLWLVVYSVSNGVRYSVNTF